MLLYFHSGPIGCSTFRSRRAFLVHRQQCEVGNAWELLREQLLGQRQEQLQEQLLGQQLEQLQGQLLEWAVGDRHCQPQFLRNSRTAQAWSMKEAEGT